MIKLKGVYKVYFPQTPNQVIALNNININVREGDFVTIIGSNGAGKSTLLKILAGIDKVDMGQVELAGEDITNYPEYARAKDIGRIDQNPLVSTAAQMTIEENLAMAYMRGKKRGLHKGITKKRQELFRDVLKSINMGLEKRLQVPVNTLSGGQRQALALIMATLAEPKLLLLDEHTAALDPKVAKEIMDITCKIVETKKLTTLMITHNMEQAIKFGNRLMMMHRGKIILDIDEVEKARLTIPQLIEKFTAVSGDVFADDRVLLAN